ncbi:MAG: 50S ribosomal protein L24 [Pseudomonadota bacterium]
MRKIKKGDDVVVVCGKDKGRRGTVQKVLGNGRVIVDNINMVKKHVKPNPNAGVAGGIVEQEASMDVSNVMLFNPAKEAGDRVGFKVLEDGKKVRYFKSNGEAVDG